MRLSALLGSACDPDPDIVGATADSRAVRPGFLFAALEGEKSDGASFIPQAEAAGAAAILVRPGVQTRAPAVYDADPRRRLAAIAAALYPCQPEIVAGVTGTNGKSSTVRFAAQLWNALGAPAGSIGTIGAEGPNFLRKLTHTTPDPVELHKTIDAMTAAGARRLAMEVSSHALDQRRADGVRFRLAGFTNITQDHLDFHKTFEAYFDAKKRLFTVRLDRDGVAVVNADGEGAEEVRATALARGVRVLTTGAGGRDLQLLSATPTADGLDIEVVAEGRAFRVSLPLVGAFQAENALVAAGLVVASGERADDVLPLLHGLEGAPGRMQRVADVAGAGVYVDYAHTPDAVATALAAIRPHAAGKVVAIIGAGGDRDPGKRPLMGAAAARAADIVIVTDDNPRSEEPAAIRRAVLAGAPD
ncbi:MAG: UDP-N-acetylmuramoyl-L-alanyl-D-glutamate--2,6-diaminopimelate ligase, partial [Parvularculaceae bacterium]|nr:UDP-N-acetylmuramoyl-L-alanyl-D-glutamate--2,6-diaminopimelate ligase [Parvularculaceae bacterium]